MLKLRNFTLVELLIVIAIITLLAAMLLPGLKKANDLAKKIVCLNNLKQWGVAVDSYVIDNNGCFPLAAYDPAPSGQWYNKFLAPYLGKPSYNPGDSSTWWYKKNGLHRCPIRTAYSPGIDSTYSDYLINWDVCPVVQTGGTILPSGGAVPPATKFAAIKQTTRTLLLIDGRYGYGNLDYRQRTDPGYQWCSVDYRHFIGANMLFVDGHVTWSHAPMPGQQLDVAAQMGGFILFE
ncbi:MAG: hypothetical protein A2X49_02625 [Lentisphaerae bacterium GWF2_52_8]|nr:MAG: hypothetical protein A2X49_02625 [Lentisphaerae bacterium GWF2_52_8]